VPNAGSYRHTATITSSSVAHWQPFGEHNQTDDAAPQRPEMPNQITLSVVWSPHVNNSTAPITVPPTL
jgi:hypothetical protein